MTPTPYLSHASAIVKIISDTSLDISERGYPFITCEAIKRVARYLEEGMPVEPKRSKENTDDQ